MMKPIHILAIAATVGTAAAGTAATTSASHAPKPKVTMSEARAIAHKAAPGKIIKSEYEKEGGSYRYSFDIQQKNNVQEIGVDAMTGKVVENKSEGRTDTDKHKKG